MLKVIGRIGSTGILAACALLLGGCAATSSSSSDTRDLTRGQDLDLSGYRQVIIDPVSVAFDSRWRPVQTGSHLEISQKERARVEREIAAMFDSAFRDELTANGHLRVVERAGPGVLRITPELVDVYMNAPTPMSQPGTTYTRSVGNATLHLVFRDAGTGEQVLELHDRVRGRDIGLLRPANPVYNRHELTRIFEDWAQVVRQDLFRAP